MRIALFGGSFDPPHRGHIGIARAAAERLALDRVLVAPVGRQPLKRDQAQSSYADRLTMVRLACEGHACLEPSELDAPLADARFNYTYDTLERLHGTLTAQDAMFCLIGADSLMTLRRWHRAAEAMFRAEWIIAARPGFALETLGELLPDGVVAGPAVERGGAVCIPLSRAPGAGVQGALWLLPDLHYEISATELRRALADHSAGVPQRVLDPRVAEYARGHRLYEAARSTHHAP